MYQNVDDADATVYPYQKRAGTATMSLSAQLEPADWQLEFRFFCNRAAFFNFGRNVSSKYHSGSNLVSSPKYSTLSLKYAGIPGCVGSKVQFRSPWEHLPVGTHETVGVSCLQKRLATSEQVGVPKRDSP